MPKIFEQKKIKNYANSSIASFENDVYLFSISEMVDLYWLGKKRPYYMLHQTGGVW